LGEATALGFNGTACFDRLHPDLVWSAPHGISQTLTKHFSFFIRPASAFAPIGANVVGPPDVATRISASIAACHSADSRYVPAGVLEIGQPDMVRPPIATDAHRMRAHL
jgi:hypothetical protein